MTVFVIIVAAGRGTRFGGETPKQYVPLSGACALHRSVDAFLKIEGVSGVVATIHADDRKLYNAAVEGVTDPRLRAPVAGGSTRAASVRNGLESLVGQSPNRVLIHDAARPFVPTKVINGVIDALDHSDGACAALPLVDAIWRADDEGHAIQPIGRDGVWRAQTPQGFRFQPILDAHRAHDGTGVDDVSVAREAGLAIQFVPGSERSFKITTHDDLKRALSEASAEDGNRSGG